MLMQSPVVPNCHGKTTWVAPKVTWVSLVSARSAAHKVCSTAAHSERACLWMPRRGSVEERPVPNLGSYSITSMNLLCPGPHGRKIPTCAVYVLHFPPPPASSPFVPAQNAHWVELVGGPLNLSAEGHRRVHMPMPPTTARTMGKKWI